MITLPRRHRMNSLAAHPRSEAQNAGQFLPLDREPVPSHDHRGREGSKMITQSVKASDD
jgi:hypothetical protein